MNVLELSADLQSTLISSLGPTSDRAEMLKRIADRAAGELKANACSIYVIEQGGRTATQLAGTGYQEQFVNRAKCAVVPADQVPEKPQDSEKLGLTGWILSTGKAFLAESPEEVVRHPHRLGIHDVKQLPDKELRLRTFLGVPLRGLRGEVIGLIKAERLDDLAGTVESFSVHDQIVLETLAQVTSKCLTYLEMTRAGNLDAAITAWTRDVIAEVAASEGEADSFLNIVIRLVAAAMHADSCGVYLIDESKKTLTERAGIGSQAPRYVIRSYELPSLEEIQSAEKPVGLTAWIAVTGQSFYAPNFIEPISILIIAANSIFGTSPKTQVRSVVHGSGSTSGRWNTRRRTEGGEHLTNRPIRCAAFTAEAQRRFDLFAQDLALAIARFQEEGVSARYRVITEAQPTIFGILRGGLDVKPLVEKVVTETALLFNARACALFLKEGNRLIQPQWAAFGWAKRGPEVRSYMLVESDQIRDNPSEAEKVGLTVWIAVKQKGFTAQQSGTEATPPSHWCL